MLQRSRRTASPLDTPQKPNLLSNNGFTVIFEKRIKMPTRNTRKRFFFLWAGRGQGGEGGCESVLNLL